MKKIICLLALACYLLPANSQEGYGEVDPGENGLVIGSKANYSHSAFVINGPCIPYYGDNLRDIVYHKKVRKFGRNECEIASKNRRVNPLCN